MTTIDLLPYGVFWIVFCYAPLTLLWIYRKQINAKIKKWRNNEVTEVKILK